MLIKFIPVFLMLMGLIALASTQSNTNADQSQITQVSCNDEPITALDALMVLRTLAGFEVNACRDLDLNEDGQVDLSDALFARKVIAGLIDPTPTKTNTPTNTSTPTPTVTSTPTPVATPTTPPDCDTTRFDLIGQIDPHHVDLPLVTGYTIGWYDPPQMGCTQTVFVTATSPTEIEYVRIDIGGDSGVKTYRSFEPESGTKTDGIWKLMWVTNDTYIDSYVIDLWVKNKSEIYPNPDCNLWLPGLIIEHYWITTVGGTPAGNCP